MKPPSAASCSGSSLFAKVRGFCGRGLGLGANKAKVEGLRDRVEGLRDRVEGLRDRVEGLG